MIGAYFMHCTSLVIRINLRVITVIRIPISAYCKTLRPLSLVLSHLISLTRKKLKQGRDIVVIYHFDPGGIIVNFEIDVGAYSRGGLLEGRWLIQKCYSLHGGLIAM